MRGAAIAVLIAVLSLSACGQKGPLYLPQDTGPAATASEPEQQQVDEQPGATP